MVAIMKYESGLVFTGYVCEDEYTAKKFIKETLGWVNENCWHLVPAKYVYTETVVKKAL